MVSDVSDFCIFLSILCFGWPEDSAETINQTMHMWSWNLLESRSCFFPRLWAYLGLNIGYRWRKLRRQQKRTGLWHQWHFWLGWGLLYTDKIEPSQPKNSPQLASLRYEWVAVETQRITVAAFTKSHSYTSPTWHTQTKIDGLGLKTIKNCLSSHVWCQDESFFSLWLEKDGPPPCAGCLILTYHLLCFHSQLGS